MHKLPSVLIIIEYQQYMIWKNRGNFHLSLNCFNSLFLSHYKLLLHVSFFMHSSEILNHIYCHSHLLSRIVTFKSLSVSDYFCISKLIQILFILKDSNGSYYMLPKIFYAFTLARLALCWYYYMDFGHRRQHWAQPVQRISKEELSLMGFTHGSNTSMDLPSTDMSLFLLPYTRRTWTWLTCMNYMN